MQKWLATRNQQQHQQTIFIHSDFDHATLLSKIIRRYRPYSFLQVFVGLVDDESAHTLVILIHTVLAGGLNPFPPYLPPYLRPRITLDPHGEFYRMTCHGLNRSRCWGSVKRGWKILRPALSLHLLEVFNSLEGDANKSNWVSEI